MLERIEISPLRNECGMPNPSYYFTLFKKFQVINHVPTNTVHGSAAPPGGFDLKDPNAAFGNSPAKGPFLGAPGANPANTPLWAILDAKARGLSTVVVGANSWRAMPLFVTTAWTDFQVNAPPPKLVDVFANWINAGKVNDVPGGVIGTVPAPIGGTLDQDVSLFVCSVAGDDGTRPGTVPPDFWNSSLIFLVNPANGNIENPPELSASSEYYLTAVVGNRGNAAGGRYLSPPAMKIEAAGWVMVWNTGMSPAVQLPALSNLDVNSTNGVYEVYFLRAREYEVVGFRLNVQTVFDGLVKAIDASGMNLGGLTAAQWVHAQGAHLCAKVLVRKEGDSWPLVGDTPFTDRRLAQKNIAPFAVDLAVVSPDPNIIWKNFVVGDVFKFMRLPGRSDDRWGVHKLTIKTKLPPGALRLYLAVPKRSFARWFRKNAIKGFKLIDEKSLHGLKAPFPEHVILMLVGRENSIEIPALREEFLAVSLGVQYSVKRLKEGAQGTMSVVQQTVIPTLDVRRKCYKIEPVTVGGFTLKLDVQDSRRMPKYGARAG